MSKVRREELNSISRRGEIMEKLEKQELPKKPIGFYNNRKTFMKILIAPDSYKECLPAREVTAAMAEGVFEAYPSAEVIQLPLADGGEGTLEVLAPALGAKMTEVLVADALGRPVKAHIGIHGTTGIIEAAQACGLGLLASSERNPLLTTTRGVGDMILAAVEAGCTHLLIGLGGSATCDGGAGMLSVPGAKDALRKVSIEILCDVENPFVGPMGAARVFAPQKGASASDVEVLEKQLRALASQYEAETGVDVSLMKGAGAAGGLGGALMAYSGATMTSGVEKVLSLLDFDDLAKDADLIITGEGRSDAQTLSGKVPVGVLRHAHGVPVLLVSGAVFDADELLEAGFSGIYAVSPAGMPLEEAILPEVARRNILESFLEISGISRVGNIAADSGIGLVLKTLGLHQSLKNEFCHRASVVPESWL